MYKDKDEAMKAMKENNPKQFFVLDSIHNLIDKKIENIEIAKEEDNTLNLDLSSLGFRLYFIMERFFIFNKARGFDKGIQFYLNGDKDTAYKILSEAKEKTDYLFFYNDLNLDFFFSVLEDIKTLTELDIKSFIDAIEEKLLLVNEEEKAAHEKYKNQFSYKYPIDYVMVNYKKEMYSFFEDQISFSNLEDQTTKAFSSLIDELLSIKKQA